MRTAIFVIAAACAVACNNAQPAEVPNRPESDDEIAWLSPNDAEMNAAMEHAKESFGAFESTLKQQDTGASDYSIKMAFKEKADSTEYMWLNDLFFDNGKLYGVLGNYPATVTSVHFGDTVEVERDAVSDWMYVRAGKLVGGYTVRTLYNRMSDEEKKEYLKSETFTID